MLWDNDHKVFNCPCTSRVCNATMHNISQVSYLNDIVCYIVCYMSSDIIFVFNKGYVFSVCTLIEPDLARQPRLGGLCCGLQVEKVNALICAARNGNFLFAVERLKIPVTSSLAMIGVHLAVL